MSYDYVDGTERIGDLIVQVVADTSGIGDPRENDNTSEMVCLHRRYSLGDRQKLTPGEDEALEHGGFKGLVKHLQRQPDGLVAITKIGMYDHSGISIYPVSDGGNGTHAFDSAGWDSGILGFAFITRKRWHEFHGAETDPDELVEGEMAIGFGRVSTLVRRADQSIGFEISEYDDWLKGNVWGYVITKPCAHADEHSSDEDIARCPHSETIESVWGMIGDTKPIWEDARSEAKAMAEPITS